MGSRHEHTAGAVTKGMWRTRVRGNLTMQRNSIAFLYIPLHQGLIFLALYCVSSTVQGSFPGSLPSQPRSPFALHSFYWAVTPFVTILIKIIINNKITTLEKDNEPTSLGRLPPLSASPRLNSNPCFLHLIIISPSASSHHE